MGLLTQPPDLAPLRQGDILRLTGLFETADDGDEAVPVESVEFILVLSRHCNAYRKTSIVVAQVTEVTPAQFTDLGSKSLDETRRFLSALRDGDGSPDRFYLGSLPKREPQRAFACLDRMYTIQLPKEGAERVRWIKDRRVAALSDDHRRHLHSCILVAFGREGFDDFAWLPDGDLRLMIAAGTKAKNDAMNSLVSTVQALEGAAATKGDVKKRTAGIGVQSRNAENAVDEASKALEPYLKEWSRRHGERNPLAQPD